MCSSIIYHPIVNMLQRIQVKWSILKGAWRNSIVLSVLMFWLLMSHSCWQKLCFCHISFLTSLTPRDSNTSPFGVHLCEGSAGRWEITSTIFPLCNMCVSTVCEHVPRILKPVEANSLDAAKAGKLHSAPYLLITSESLLLLFFFCKAVLIQL